MSASITSGNAKTGTAVPGAMRRRQERAAYPSAPTAFEAGERGRKMFGNETLIRISDIEELLAIAKKHGETYISYSTLFAAKLGKITKVDLNWASKQLKNNPNARRRAERASC